MSRQENELIPTFVGTIVGEPRRAPRYHLLTRVDILPAGSSDVYWGSMCNLSRSAVAVAMRQRVKTHERVMVRFHLQSRDGREIIEGLAAKAAWPCGGDAGWDVHAPLTAGPRA